MIPPSAQWFQARAETARLVQVLVGGGRLVVESIDGAPASVVLAGMGGVGKTQLAADYARTAWHAGELDVLVWVTASDRPTIVSRYAQAAAMLLAADTSDPEAAAQEFLAWLDWAPGRPRCRWLVVLDDINDPADLNGLWPPTSRTGRTLGTSRRNDASLTGQHRQRIEVGQFTTAEAVGYLTQALAAHDRCEPDDQLGALAQDLGHLPLALAQAAAYLIDANISCAGYRTLLADRATTLVDASPDALPDGQTHTMAASWNLSIDRADTLRPRGLARPMLQLAAFLDPNGIPAAVLSSKPALFYLAKQHSEAASPSARPVTSEQARLALGALRRLSLIDYLPNTQHQAVRVHQLIQRAVRDALTSVQRDQRARTAADALAAEWPRAELDSTQAQTLRANCTALTTWAGDALYQPDAHAVLYRAGRSLGEAGQATAAREYFRKLTDATTRYLGPDHPHALTAMGNLARWRGEAGDAAGAAAAFAGVLDGCLRLLGPDHADTLTIRSHLARWRGQAGDAAGASSASAELLDDCLRVLGPGHPHTLTARHDLATWRGEAGDAAGAAAAFAEMLEDRLRVLGPDHPDTLAVQSNLASWRGMAGDAASAAALFAEVLEDRLRVLGPDHPDSLTTRGNLAYWRGMAGDVRGAAVATAELLDDMTRLLGADHPNTLSTHGNLVRWQGQAGDVDGARAASVDLLEHMKRVLGPDHPRTLTARHNLAHWQGRAGDAAGAAAAFAELLDDRLRVLGFDHPHTHLTRRHLASWQSRAQDSHGEPVRERQESNEDQR